MVVTLNMNALGIMWTFLQMYIVASSSDINEINVSYFEGTANLQLSKL